MSPGPCCDGFLNKKEDFKVLKVKFTFEMETASRSPHIDCHNTCSPDDVALMMTQWLTAYIYQNAMDNRLTMAAQHLLINPMEGVKKT